ncbi:DUF6578 domain-containing protein [Micromonospora sp. LZ34]
MDDWQLQCCGDPFAVGAEVSWTLRDADSEWLAEMLGSGSAIGVDAAEEHHGDLGEDAPLMVGTVASIDAVHCRYAPLLGSEERGLHPVPGSGTLSTVNSADGWTPDRGDLTFVGYLVRLTGAATRSRS